MEDKYIHRVGDDSFVVSDSVVPPVSPFGVGDSDHDFIDVFDDTLAQFAVGSAVLAWIAATFADLGAPWIGAIATAPTAILAFARLVKWKGRWSKVGTLLLLITVALIFVKWGVTWGR